MNQNPISTQLGMRGNVNASDGTTLRIIEVNPLEYERELKQLFAANDRESYAEFFGRAYPGAVAEGATSWVGVDPHGRVIMHAARFPHSFRYLGERIRAGLVVNIMVDQPYRTSGLARSLLSFMAEDTRRSNYFDFLYSDPNERAGRVLQGCGYLEIGRLARHVLPLRAGRWAGDVLLNAYLSSRRLLLGIDPWTVKMYSAADFDDSSLAEPGGAALQGIHSSALYRRRLAGYPGPRDRWVTVYRHTDEEPAAAALVRGPCDLGIATIAKYWCRPEVNLAQWVLASAGELRAIGCRRLQVLTIRETEAARSLRWVGFVSRESVPVMVLPLTDLGAQAAQDVSRWEFTQMDGDS